MTLSDLATFSKRQSYVVKKIVLEENACKKWQADDLFLRVFHAGLSIVQAKTTLVHRALLFLVHTV